MYTKDQQEILKNAEIASVADEEHYRDWAATIVRLQVEAGLTFKEAEILAPLSIGGNPIFSERDSPQTLCNRQRRAMKKIGQSGHTLEELIGNYAPDLVY